MLKVARIAAVVLLVGLVSLESVPAQDRQLVDVTGTWTGSYRSQGGNTGDSTLVLKPDAERVTGTIEVTGVARSFGNAPQQIENGRLSRRDLTFKAVGVDGGVFSADFRVGKDGDEISGWGRHTGPGYDGLVQFRYTRVK